LQLVVAVAPVEMMARPQAGVEALAVAQPALLVARAAGHFPAVGGLVVRSPPVGHLVLGPRTGQQVRLFLAATVVMALLVLEEKQTEGRMVVVVVVSEMILRLGKLVPAVPAAVILAAAAVVVVAAIVPLAELVVVVAVHLLQQVRQQRQAHLWDREHRLGIVGTLIMPEMLALVVRAERHHLVGALEIQDVSLFHIHQLPQQ